MACRLGVESLTFAEMSEHAASDYHSDSAIQSKRQANRASCCDPFQNGPDAQAADRLGGDLGDMMYFEMATVIIKRGNGDLAPLVKKMDWQRIQRGYQQMTTQFGPDHNQKNRLAFMAYQFKDQGAARDLFASIGNDWASSVWKNRKFFDRARDWSTGHTAWP
jgi:hypothetical protein